MSRYIFHKPEPIDDEIKAWLARNFDLDEVNHSPARFAIVLDRIVPKFQAYLKSMNKEALKVLIANGFVLPSSNKLTPQGVVYILYLTHPYSLT